MLCATGGGSRGGGVFRPLGTTVPWGDSPRGQGRPWPLHPEVTSPPRLCWFCVWFLLGFSGMDVGYSNWCSLSLVLECCLVWCPSGPDPCMPRCWLSLLFFFVFGIVVGVVFLLSLFLRCWGNPNPFWVLGFPLCLFPSPRSPPRLVFLFLFSTLAWVVFWVLFSVPGLAVWWSFAACVVVMYNAHSLS